MTEPVFSFPTDPHPWDPGAERRATGRYGTRLEVGYRLLGSEARQTARVRDASTLGVRLVVGNQLAVGQRLAIDFNSATGGQARAVLARVIHTAAEGPDGWLIGCAFIGELNDAELWLFQARRVRSPAQDGRSWVRFPCNVETVCYSLETTPGEQSAARILNVSAGGLALAVPCEFAVGTLLRLDLPGTLGLPGRQLLVRVVQSRPESTGNWLLGCELADRLRDDELQALR
jgi:hypothetical protein